MKLEDQVCSLEYAKKLKRCPMCGVTKPLIEYYKRKTFRCQAERFQSYCKPCVRKRTSVHYLRNAEKYREKERLRRFRLGDVLRDQKNGRRRQIRKDVIAAYGNKCACCGESQYEFLAIDHIEGGGNEHRRKIGAHALVYWLKKFGYPPNGYQVLCHNCNMAKGFYGRCPHGVRETSIVA